jgi:hypothetical protein
VSIAAVVLLLVLAVPLAIGTLNESDDDNAAFQTTGSAISGAADSAAGSEGDDGREESADSGGAPDDQDAVGGDQRAIEFAEYLGTADDAAALQDLVIDALDEPEVVPTEPEPTAGASGAPQTQLAARLADACRQRAVGETGSQADLVLEGFARYDGRVVRVYLFDDGDDRWRLIVTPQDSCDIVLDRRFTT